MNIEAKFTVNGGRSCIDRSTAISDAASARCGVRKCHLVTVVVTGEIFGDPTGDTAMVTWYSDGGAEVLMCESGETTVTEAFESSDAESNFRKAIRVAHGFVIAG